MSANLPTRPEFPFLSDINDAVNCWHFMFVPLQLPDLQGGEGEVLWGDTGMLVCRTNYGHMVETCWTGKFDEIRINSEISGWGVKLEWPHFESSKYSLIHICYMCGYVLFKRRTYTKTRFSRFQAFNHDESRHEFAPLQTARLLQPFLRSKERLIKRDMKITRSCEAKKDWARPKDSGKRMCDAPGTLKAF